MQKGHRVLLEGLHGSRCLEQGSLTSIEEDCKESIKETKECVNLRSERKQSEKCEVCMEY